MVKTYEKLGNGDHFGYHYNGYVYRYRKPEVYLSSHKIKILMRMLFIKLEYGKN
jgi:hypothetical protein